jgi:transketolase
MRRTFFQELHKQMTLNDKVWALTGDLGYIGFDQIRKDYPKRFINCGASEFAMMGIACGLALDGKIPFVYSITTFLLYRPFEVLRTSINHEKLNVKLCASGRDFDYKDDGWSHHSPDAKQILDCLPNIKQLWPTDKKEIPLLVEQMVKETGPVFISLKR